MAVPDLDLKYSSGAIKTSKSVAVGGNLTVTGTLTAGGASLAPPNTPLPADHGAIGWTGDPRLHTGTISAVNGTIYLARVPVRTAATIGTVWWCQTTGPTTPTTGQNWVGLYSSAGTLLSSVGVDGKTGNGPQNGILAAPQAVAAGFVWVALMFNAATPPVLMRAAGQSAAANVFNQAAANYQYAVNGTTAGLTALPSSFVPGSNSLTGATAFWAAVS